MRNIYIQLSVINSININFAQKFYNDYDRRSIRSRSEKRI